MSRESLPQHAVFSALSSAVTGAPLLSADLEGLESTLSSARSLLVAPDPLDHPRQDARERTAMESGEALVLGQKQKLNEAQRRQIALMSDELRLHERLCLDFWATVSKEADRRWLELRLGLPANLLRYDIPLAARHLYFYERSCGLLAVKELLKGRLDPNMPPRLGALLHREANVLLRDGLPTSLMGIVRNLSYEIKATLGSPIPTAISPASGDVDAHSALEGPSPADARRYRLGFLTRMLDEAAEALFYVFYATQAAPEEVYELLSLVEVLGNFAEEYKLHQDGDDTQSGSIQAGCAGFSALCVLLSAVSCALDQKHELIDRNTGAANSFGAGNALLPPHDATPNPDSSKEAFSNAVLERTTNKTWKHTGSQAFCSIVVGLFLTSSRVQDGMINERVKRAYSKALELRAFSFIAGPYLLALRSLHGITEAAISLVPLCLGVLGEMIVNVTEADELLVSTSECCTAGCDTPASWGSGFIPPTITVWRSLHVEMAESIASSRPQMIQQEDVEALQRPDLLDDIIDACVNLVNLTLHIESQSLVEMPSIGQRFISSGHPKKFLQVLGEAVERESNLLCQYLKMLTAVANASAASAFHVYSFLCGDGALSPGGVSWRMLYASLHEAAVFLDPNPSALSNSGQTLSGPPTSAATQSGESTSRRALPENDIETLMRICNLIQALAFSADVRGSMIKAPIAGQSSLFGAPEPLEALLWLLVRPVPPDLKGAIFKALAAFASESKLARGILQALTEAQVLPTRTLPLALAQQGKKRANVSEKNPQGILLELEGVESVSGTYPSIDGFIVLLHSLVEHGALLTTDPGARVPSLQHFLEFLLDHVLLKSHGRFYRERRMGEKFKLSARILRLFLTILKYYPLGSPDDQRADPQLRLLESEHCERDFTGNGTPKSSGYWLMMQILGGGPLLRFLVDFLITQGDGVTGLMKDSKLQCQAAFWAAITYTLTVDVGSHGQGSYSVSDLHRQLKYSLGTPMRQEDFPDWLNWKEEATAVGLELLVVAAERQPSFVERLRRSPNLEAILHINSNPNPLALAQLLMEEPSWRSREARREIGGAHGLGLGFGMSPRGGRALILKYYGASSDLSEVSPLLELDASKAHNSRVPVLRSLIEYVKFRKGVRDQKDYRIPLLSLKLLHVISGGIDSARLVSLLQAPGDAGERRGSDDLLDDFITGLLTDSSFEDATVEAGVRSSTGFAAGTEFDFFNLASATTTPKFSGLRELILDLIIENMDAPFPNLSHCLLGLASADSDIMTGVDRSLDPPVPGCPRNCLDAILELLEPGGTNAAFDDLKATEKSFRIILKLVQLQLAPLLTLLRSRSIDFFPKMLSFLGTWDYSRKDDAFLRRHCLGHVLKASSVELHSHGAQGDAGLGGQAASRLLHLLLDASSDFARGDRHSQTEADPEGSIVSADCLLLRLVRVVPLVEDAGLASVRAPKPLTRDLLESCSRSGGVATEFGIVSDLDFGLDQRFRLIDLDLLAEQLKNLLPAQTPTSPGLSVSAAGLSSNPNADAMRVALEWADAWNQFSGRAMASAYALESHRVLVEVLMKSCWSMLNPTPSSSLAFAPHRSFDASKTLLLLALGLGDHLCDNIDDADMTFLEPLSRALLSVIGSMRLPDPKASDRSFGPGSTQLLLRDLCKALLRAHGSSEVFRGNITAALVHYLRVTQGPVSAYSNLAQLENASTALQMENRRLNLQVLSSMAEPLALVLMRDALSGALLYQSVATSALALMLETFSSAQDAPAALLEAGNSRPQRLAGEVSALPSKAGELTRAMLHVFGQQGYIIMLSDRIESPGKRPESMQMMLVLLSKLAATAEGTKMLLDAGLVAKLARANLFGDSATIFTPDGMAFDDQSQARAQADANAQAQIQTLTLALVFLNVILSKCGMDATLHADVCAFLCARGELITQVFRGRDRSLQGMKASAEVAALLMHLAGDMSLFVEGLGRLGETLYTTALAFAGNLGRNPLPAFDEASRANLVTFSKPLPGATPSWWESVKPTTARERLRSETPAPSPTARARQGLEVYDVWTLFDWDKLMMSQRLLSRLLGFIRRAVQVKDNGTTAVLVGLKPPMAELLPVLQSLSLALVAASQGGSDDRRAGPDEAKDFQSHQEHIEAAAKVRASLEWHLTYEVEALTAIVYRGTLSSTEQELLSHQAMALRSIDALLVAGEENVVLHKFARKLRTKFQAQ